ncbi:MAG: M23 family metallopeptidase [Saprospiraceae bacterium]|nr:M23 family metallopeptidase [Saprospiraceae bacterium]
MGRQKFIYNTHTLRYERVEESLSTRLLRVFGFICAALFTAFIITVISHRYFPSPKEKALMREIGQMRSEFGGVLSELDLLGEELKNIQDRDAYAHRMIFGMDPIDEGVWQGGVGGHDEYAEYRQLKNSGDLIISAKKKVSKLKRQMVLQSKSLDTVLNMAAEKEKMLASIPSIKPVRSDKLPRSVRLLSGFGRRIHPIYKMPRMHYGIDFTAPTNTPIQATGAGTVVRVERKRTGYGKSVIIDHGFGYQTLYAHMNRIDVKTGEKVKRGQQIGIVGSTGTSTAPHCHYEVHFKGQKVNPIHYVMDGLSPEEYQELVKISEMANQSFD